MSGIIQVKLENAMENTPLVDAEKELAEAPRDDLPRPHFLMLASGQTESGKTAMTCRVLYEYLTFGCFTRLFALTPSWDDDEELQHLGSIVLPGQDVLDRYDREQGMQSPSEKRKGILPHDLCKGRDAHLNCIAFVEYIEMQAKEDMLRWRINVMDRMVFPEVVDRIRHEEATEEDYEFYEFWNGEMPPALPKPSYLFIIDDMQGTEIMSEGRRNPLSSMIIRHRHIEGCGLSAVFMTQSYKAGLPKKLRQQMTMLMLFKDCSEQNIEGYAEECSNHVSKEQFKEIYDAACFADERATGEKNHNFLFVSKTAKSAMGSFIRFRKNFDTVLYVPPTGVADIGKGTKRKRSREEEEDQEDVEL